ncbi:hypothetical protein COM97_03615 [Bacillus thuringiensis]|uniref:hypothetical protein n=1 Tax=Bacillus thuringiensis TaxID=1428 RepID=UPI000BED69B4|nr:hypothetical protein [Bacillus thuringiensis]PEF07906.1 hypothetical protein COM97_03615 [Bacillus thuringiensis]
MTYYTDNAFYKYIRDENIDDFEYVSGDLWQLVYGNSVCEPKLLVLASSTSPEKLDSNPTPKEMAAFYRLNEVARRANLSKMFIRFDASVIELDSVMILTNEGFKKCEIDALTKHFASKGLPVNDTRTEKDINDKSSSAYQNWQRNHLGRDLKVSDIDLFKLDEKNQIQVIYELKRAQNGVKTWNPYEIDYNNYRLIGNLCAKAKIDFKVGYNRRVKVPFKDDLSEILTLDVTIERNNPTFSNRTYLTPNEFFGQ